MNQKLSKIFKEMKQIEPKKELESLILQKIALEKNRQTRRKLVISYAGLFVSFAAIFPAILKFGVALFHSEFWSILSLAFSDFWLIVGSWKEYLYSLGETLPVVNIVAIFVPVLGLLAFLNLLVSVKNNKNASRNINMQAFQH